MPNDNIIYEADEEEDMDEGDNPVLTYSSIEILRAQTPSANKFRLSFISSSPTPPGPISFDKILIH